MRTHEYPLCSNISEINDFVELTKSNPGSSSSSFFDTLKVGNIAFFVLAKFENELELVTGRARLIRSHSLARFCFELSGNLN